MTPADAMIAFIKRQAELHKVKEEKVKEDLRKEFGTFNINKTSQYQQYLYKLYKGKLPEKPAAKPVKKNYHKPGSEVEVKRLSEVLDQFIESYEFHFPEKCPYHPDATVTGDIARGKSAWVCSEGGRTCQHKAFADMQAAKDGIAIDWEAFERFQVIGGGTIEEYRAWLNGSSKVSGE